MVSYPVGKFSYAVIGFTNGAEGDMEPFCLPTCTPENPCPEGFRCNPTSDPNRDVCVPKN